MEKPGRGLYPTMDGDGLKEKFIVQRSPNRSDNF